MIQRIINYKSIKNHIENKEAAALVLVVLLLMVSTILVLSVAFLTQSNTAMAHRQQQGIQSYYIARSGAELAYEAIVSDPAEWNYFENNDDWNHNPQTITFPEGEATIIITADTVNDIRRVRITSIGMAEGVERTVVLSVEHKNNGRFVWSR
ncbi:hypothetical protein [Anoxynatronum sibiricum]|uniref:Type 4 fimbrial biogenesis protein PilX N-terminal domain-containing protein n=1 Tax=Anoxynatronum sibiricum TaxID=210623 RepID=A0ABU9VQ53_9CLOT